MTNRAPLGDHLELSATDRLSVSSEAPAPDLPSGPPPAPPPTLGGLFAGLWRGKWIVLAALAVTLGLASAYLALAKPKYTGYMIIAPQAGQEAGGRGSLGSVARYLGVGGQEAEAVTTFQRFLNGMTSVPVAERLEAKHDLLVRLFPTDWDAAAGEWRQPDGTIAPMVYGLFELFGLPGWVPPDVASLAGYLRKNLQVTTVNDTAIHRIAFTHGDRAFIDHLLRWTVAETDAYLREQARAEAEARIAYLRDKLTATTRDDLRSLLLTMLSTEEQKLMMVNLNDGYAIRVMEGPVVGGAPSSPNLILAFAAAILGGLFIGVTIVAMRGTRRTLTAGAA